MCFEFSNRADSRSANFMECWLASSGTYLNWYTDAPTTRMELLLVRVGEDKIW